MLILKIIFTYKGSLGSKWLNTFTRTGYICSSPQNIWSISECCCCKRPLLWPTVFLSHALNICLCQELSSLLTNISLIKLFPYNYRSENSKTTENNHCSHPQMVRKTWLLVGLQKFWEKSSVSFTAEWKTRIWRAPFLHANGYLLESELVVKGRHAISHSPLQSSVALCHFSIDFVLLKIPQESICLTCCLATRYFVLPKIPNDQELIVTEKYSNFLINDLRDFIILEQKQ